MARKRDTQAEAEDRLRERVTDWSRGAGLIITPASATPPTTPEPPGGPGAGRTTYNVIR